MEHIGVVCGRFQIFHNEHLQYVMAAKEQCEHLIVGITSPDPSVSPVEKQTSTVAVTWRIHAPIMSA